MVDPIRLSNDPSRRKVGKHITVEVEVRPEELASTLTRDEVVRLCARHRIQLKSNGGRGGGKVKIGPEEIGRMSDDLRAGDVEGVLIRLERVLPLQFRHFSEDVARFYRGRA